MDSMLQTMFDLNLTSVDDHRFSLEMTSLITQNTQYVNKSSLFDIVVFAEQQVKNISEQEDGLTKKEAEYGFKSVAQVYDASDRGVGQYSSQVTFLKRVSLCSIACDSFTGTCLVPSCATSLDKIFQLIQCL